MKKRAVIYTRVSTLKHSQEKSLKSQEEHYIDYCERSGFEYKRLYAEKGVTGTNARIRPKFIEMLHDAGLDFERNDNGKDYFNLSNREKKFDYIVVKDPSRFSRSAAIGLEVIEQLRTKEVYVIFENSGYTSEEAGWHFNMTILFTVAQTESYNMSNRIKFSKKHMANKGEYKPARCPFGYIRNEENKIVIEPNQAETVTYIFNRFLEVGSNIITKELNERGAKSQTGINFSPDKVLRVINNSVYYGSPKVNKSKKQNVTDIKREKNKNSEFITIPNAVDPIVSKELWDEANKIRVSRINKSSKRGRKTAKNDVFFGKLICSCGSRMVRHTGENDKITYMCQTRRKSGNCVSRGISINVLNRSLRQIDLRYMTNTLGDTIYFKQLVNQLAKQKTDLNSSQKVIQSQIDELRKEAKNYAVQFASLKKGAMKDSLIELAEEKQSEIAEIESKLEQLNIVAIERIQKKIADKKEMIETLFNNKNFTPEEKLTLLKKVDINDYELTFHFSLPTYEEEVLEYNKLFSMNPIESETPFNPFTTETIRRDHKAAKEHWETLDEELRASEEEHGYH